jgi:hypothetical protein
VVDLKPDGSFNWVNTWGGPGNSWTEAVKLNPDGMINAAGMFDQDVDFDPGPGVENRSASGGYDTFIDMLLPDGGW